MFPKRAIQPPLIDGKIAPFRSRRKAVFRRGSLCHSKIVASRDPDEDDMGEST